MAAFSSAKQIKTCSISSQARPCVCRSRVVACRAQQTPGDTVWCWRSCALPPTMLHGAMHHADAAPALAHMHNLLRLSQILSILVQALVQRQSSSSLSSSTQAGAP